MQKIKTFFKTNQKWHLVLWMIIGIFTITSLLAVNSKENNLKIKKIDVTILPESDLNFLDSATVLGIIKKDNQDMVLLNEKLRKLRIDEMETNLENNPFVEEADISVDLGGTMRIKLLQRNPILRIFNNKGQSYYVAKNGYKIPSNNTYTARVMVANGNISETLADSSFAKTKILQDLYQIALHCHNDKFWESQIEQLYVDNYNDILLIPMVGNHSIVFGSGEDLVDKFTRLKQFYFKGLNNIGWNKYRSISLKYKNQVVAEKFDSPNHATDTIR